MTDLSERKNLQLHQTIPSLRTNGGPGACNILVPNFSDYSIQNVVLGDKAI